MDLNKFLADFLGNKRPYSSDNDSNGEEDADSDLEIIEENSESEPELDCDKWDNDCKILEIKHHINVQGHHLMPSCSRDPAELASKKIKLKPEINSAFLENKYKQNFIKNWKNHQTLTDTNTEIIVDPFKVVVLNNFLENSLILNDVRQEFNEIDWNTRCMDLYEFFQSKDLKQLSESNVLSTVYDFLKSEVMSWCAEITGLELTHISATCSYYSNSDYLLVHDDQREDRLVAFVLYLSENWSQDNGGALQLLSKDKSGQPDAVVRSIYPQNNQLVFFPVTNDSYHQVDEVLALTDCRLSINGWFHAKIPPIFESPSFEPHPEGLFTDSNQPACDIDIELSSWLNEDYLKGQIAKEIQRYFEENSEICLKNFLKAGAFNEIIGILRSDLPKWIKIGPPNRYSYEVIDRNDIPSVLERFLKLFQSKQMFALLKKLTDLDLTKNSASMKYELQKWTPGSYSLLSDFDWQKKKELDLIIHFGVKDNSELMGARTQYVTIEDEIQNALITIDPEENNLNLIYRDTARFTKYYSKLSKCSCFYMLICSYSD